MADLIERVETETDPVLYDGAVDALYQRFMAAEDTEADAIMDYVQAQGKAFEKDWTAAEKRYDDTQKTRKSKNSQEPFESSIDSATVGMLNGVWTRFSQGQRLAPGKSVTLERAKQIVQKVLDRLGIAGVVNIETYRNPTEAGLTPPDGIVPAGVTLEDGRILLFSDAIATDVDVFKTVFHELFHLGLSKTVEQGSYIQQMLKFKLDPLVRQYAERWKKTADGRNRNGKMPVNNYEALSVEEALADIAEDLATDKLGSKEMNRFVRSMVERLAQLAQFVGLGDAAQRLRRMTYTDAEKFVMDTLMGANFEGASQLRSQRFRQAHTGNPKADAIQDSFTPLWSAIKEGASDLGLKVMFTRDLLAKAKKVLTGGNAAAYEQAMDRIEVEHGKFARKVDTVLEMFTALPANLRGTGPKSVNGIIKRSTEGKVWAFKPDWLKDGQYTYDASSDVAQDFRALPKKAQEVVREVFRHGYETRVEMQKALTDNVKSEYDVLIATARQSGDEKAAKAHEADKQRWLTDYKTLFDRDGNWPYAPLRRFGKYVVMGVSQEYKDADSARQKELESDGKHYFVAFAENKAQAIKMAAQISGDYADSGHFERLADADGFMSGRDMVGAFQRLRKVVSESADGLGKGSSSELDNLMRQVYLQLLSENSARKAEINRRNIAGADGDMMRAFATHGRATAHFIAKIKANNDAVEFLHRMGREVSDREMGATLSGRAEKQAIYNEVVRRHISNAEYDPDGVVSKVMAGTSVWMLLSKPSYYLQNLTQPWMMSHPVMAAKHGYMKAANQMLKAYQDLAPALKDGAFKENDYDKLPADVRQAIEKLADMGVINISLESVLGKFESTSNAPTQVLDIVTQKLSGAAQTVESVNRLSTAVAAYRLELQAELAKGTDKELADFRAVEYAKKLIYETHGDYSNFNAPRFMRSGLGRLATQFRKFQLIQLSMFARFLHDAFKGASRTERLVARRALAFNLTHLGMLGGLMAMPGFTAISWMLGAIFGDDDEPNDPEAKLRRAIGDKTLADLMLKGIPKALGGPDTSSWIGAGGMLSILPYTELKTGQEGFKDIFVGLAGPAVSGVGMRAFDGLHLWRQGDYWRGMEMMVPAGISNGLRAYRFGTDGVTRRNGDTLLSADELNTLDLTLQAIGLSPGKVVDLNQVTSSQFKADQFYRNRTTQLKRRYSEAVREGDEQARRRAIEEWQQTQEARRRLGYKTQPLSELLRAPQEQRKRERNTRDGVQFRSNNENFSAQLL